VTLGAQLIGTGLGILVALAGGFAIYGLLKLTVGIRLDPEQEFEGSDLSIHKIGATAERDVAW
jgi:Amt family ammonium transporter